MTDVPNLENPVQLVRVHLTNVNGGGLGSVQLVKSLLPALETCPNFQISEIYLPNSGELSRYHRVISGAAPIRYKRFPLNSISRFLECMVFASQFDGSAPLLVLSDLPLRSTARQILFVQTPLLSSGTAISGTVDLIKFRIARWVFRRNYRFVSCVIVQTTAMRDALESAFPETRGAIRIVSQPPPNWLLSSRLKRLGRLVARDSALRLFYPASNYPHKNHSFLQALSGEGASALPVDRLILTISKATNPNPLISWIDCVGILDISHVLDLYSSVDAIVFLSKAESYGLPLVEAMWVGLPIICPDLPYARALCGDDAIYFDVKSVESFCAAIVELHNRLGRGWWPNWSFPLARIPQNWDQVAALMLRIVADTGNAVHNQQGK